MKEEKKRKGRRGEGRRLKRSIGLAFTEWLCCVVLDLLTGEMPPWGGEGGV